jgi:hypothetical protein
MAKTLLQEIVADVPLALHREFKAAADEAIFNVGAKAKGGRLTIQQFGMALYGELDAAFISAASAAGLSVQRHPTNPPGGTCSLAEAGHFTIHRYTGQTKLALPKRRTRYLPPLLAQNRSVDTQVDMLEPVLVENGRRFGSFVTVPDYRAAKLVHLGFGLLSPNGNRWIDYWSIEELMAAYVPVETITDEAHAVVPDRAQPSLKRRK